MHQFTKVEFRRFKAFRSFTLHLRHYNILVGPNNAGKSTVLAAFRILASGLRKAHQRKPGVVPGPSGQTIGYVVDLSAISVAEENIFFDYDDSTPASVSFHLSNGNRLELHFPEEGACYLIPRAATQVRGPAQFQAAFDCPIGFVPILGPVEHNERLYEKEAARLALYNYRAARNFRNIWYHYPERFEEFRALVRQTWPGMDVEAPRVDRSHEKPLLHMFCPEERIPREIFWAGFGFQVWCQMLTHLVQSRDVSLFLIDEPDIYLHSDLQRQLVTLLRNLGPDILIATHSAEIISEAETDEIVLVDKRRANAKRIRDPAALSQVFSALGSNLNPVLTQLAKTKRAIFVEGKDFQIFSKFAAKLGMAPLASRSGFAVIPIEGFNPDRIRSIKRGVETALGGEIAAAAVLDRDFRSREECGTITAECAEVCQLTRIHRCKEVENFLLVPAAIDRAIVSRLREKARRSGAAPEYTGTADALLQEYAQEKKSNVMSQYLAFAKQFARTKGSRDTEATINQRTLEEFEADWGQQRLAMIRGKDALNSLNERVQADYGVSVTPNAIIEAMRADEVSENLRALLTDLETFAHGTAASQEE